MASLLAAVRHDNEHTLRFHAPFTLEPLHSHPIAPVIRTRRYKASHRGLSSTYLASGGYQCWHDCSASVRRSHEAQKLPLCQHVLHFTPVKSDPREDSRLASSLFSPWSHLCHVLASLLDHCVKTDSPGAVQDRARSRGLSVIVSYPYGHPAARP